MRTATTAAGGYVTCWRTICHDETTTTLQAHLGERRPADDDPVVWRRAVLGLAAHLPAEALDLRRARLQRLLPADVGIVRDRREARGARAENCEGEPMSIDPDKP